MFDEFDDLEAEEDKDDRTTSIQCANCRRKIELGHDMLIVEKGVLGPRGPIPLSEPMFFCAESCVSNYFNGIPDSDLEKFPPRIP